MSLRGHTITAIGGITYITETCCECGAPFAMNEDFRTRLLAMPGTTFYCPAGPYPEPPTPADLPGLHYDHNTTVLKHVTQDVLNKVYAQVHVIEAAS